MASAPARTGLRGGSRFMNHFPTREAHARLFVSLEPNSQQSIESYHFYSTNARARETSGFKRGSSPPLQTLFAISGMPCSVVFPCLLGDDGRACTQRASFLS